METAALIVSILAIVMSAVAYWRQVRWGRVAADAQERVARIEEDRRTDELRRRDQAVLVARFERSGRSMRFIVVNQGQALAEQVTVTMAVAAGLNGAPPQLVVRR